MEFKEIIIMLLISVTANLLFFGKKIYLFLRDWRHRRILSQFWGVPEGRSKKAYIFYPTYPNPRVDRTEKIGYYLSDEDAKTVELLQRNLVKLGFDCQRKEVSELFNADHPVPRDGIIILVCGPKLDPTTNQVVDDPWIGGNPVSSWFYRCYHKKMGIELLYNPEFKRKQYQIPIPFLGSETLYSPQDERPQENIDRGLLVRFKVDQQFFFLCWGIHGSATLGTVKVALDPAYLAKFSLHSPNIIAVVQAEKIDEISGDVLAGAVGYPLPEKDITPILKPDPFSPGAWLPAERPVYGLSYLWATTGNVENVKKGNYVQLAPVAAEFDASLYCPYNCSWCPYRQDRTGEILKDEKKALAIVDKIAESGVRLVVLTGGGEPLESNCVEAVAERCRHHKMLVTLYTNGLLLNDLRAYHLMSRGVSEIRISLDDVSSVENYMAIHGLRKDQRKAMEDVEYNTRQLLGLRARNGFSTRIGASFLVSDKTLSNLERSAVTLSKWLHKVGPFDYVAIRPAVKYWPGGEPHNAYFKGGDADFNMLKKAAQQFKEKGVARHIFISWQRFRDLNKYSPNAYGKCLASTLWLNIGPDGTAYLCCETKHKSSFKLGNILEKPLDELLKSALINATRSIPFGSAGCPVLLCKPSALNQLFDEIESYRKDGSLPEHICKWLNAVAEYNLESGTTALLIPSVSGIYEEYPLPYNSPSHHSG
ncbi:MAG: radical SAM protein [Syntrophales bacterium]|nr:radical SAM protein [Syntrophales bacterium]